MAVAWSRDKLGSDSEPMTVRDAVPAELSLPRFVAPGDTASATLLIDNVDGAAGKVTFDNNLVYESFRLAEDDPSLLEVEPDLAPVGKWVTTTLAPSCAQASAGVQISASEKWKSGK